MKLSLFSYPLVKTYVVAAQLRLIEKVLLSTQNICFGQEITFHYTFLSTDQFTVKYDVCDCFISCRFLVTVFHEKVCVYDSCQFKQLFWITSKLI